MSEKMYDDLVPRQQHLVDELARERVESLDRTLAEIAEDAAEGTKYDPYNESYASTLRAELGDVIDERTQVLANDGLPHGEADGTVRVEVGNGTYEGPAEGLNLAESDGEANSPAEAREVRRMLAQAQTGESEYVVTLSRKDVLAVLRSDVPDATAKKVFAAVAE